MTTPGTQCHGSGASFVVPTMYSEFIQSAKHFRVLHLFPSGYTKHHLKAERTSIKAPPVSTTNSYNASKSNAKHTNNTEYQCSTKSEEMRVFYQFAAPRNPVQTGKAKRKLHNFVAQRYRCSQRSLAQNTHHALTKICSFCCQIPMSRLASSHTTLTEGGLRKVPPTPLKGDDDVFAIL